VEYADLADLLALGGTTNEEKVVRLIKVRGVGAGGSLPLIPTPKPHPTRAEQTHTLNAHLPPPQAVEELKAKLEIPATIKEIVGADREAEYLVGDVGAGLGCRPRLSPLCPCCPSCLQMLLSPLVLPHLSSLSVSLNIPLPQATLEQLSEQAFDDQCTGANPRYPLMKVCVCGGLWRSGVGCALVSSAERGAGQESRLFSWSHTDPPPIPLTLADTQNTPPRPPIDTRQDLRQMYTDAWTTPVMDVIAAAKKAGCAHEGLGFESLHD
jgi:hypothetical protein